MRRSLFLVALVAGCSDVDVVPFDDPRWADAVLSTRVTQRGVLMDVVVEAVLGCAAVTDDTVAVVADVERELDAIDSRPNGCEAACGSCGGVGPRRPITIRNADGEVTTGFRSADGALVAVAQGGLATRSLALAGEDAVAADSLLELQWSVRTDSLTVREVTASRGGEPETWPAATGDAGVISVQVPAGTVPGRWTITVPAQVVEASVTSCDAASCAVRIFVEELSVVVDVTA